MLPNPNSMKMTLAVAALLSVSGFSILHAARKPVRPVEVVVVAKARATATGITVKSGDTLRFTTPVGATWRDSSVTVQADGSGGGCLFESYMSLWRWALVAPKHPPFSLVGRVGDGKPFFIGKGVEVKLADSGPLVLFANDVPGFYWNNKGTMPVRITKKK